MAMRPEISVKDLLMQAFLTGWELSDKSISQDEYLQSAIQVIEVLQVEPENLYAEEGLGLPDGEEVDHLDDLLRADGQWPTQSWQSWMLWATAASSTSWI